MAYTNYGDDEYPNLADVRYSVLKIDNGYLLDMGFTTLYYRTKKQVAAAITRHLMKEVN